VDVLKGKAQALFLYSNKKEKYSYRCKDINNVEEERDADLSFSCNSFSHLTNILNSMARNKNTNRYLGVF
jgi:hypothetical protein